MKKPTIYLDTNIISALHYSGSDINAMAHRMATRDWWESERRFFSMFASVVTEQELARGVFGNQRTCLRFVRKFRYVPISANVRKLAGVLVEQGVVPATEPGDAAQLAVAIVHNMDYLLTWNYAHLANPVTQARGEKILKSLEYRMPWLVSPDSIARETLGQTIRRTDDA